MPVNLACCIQLNQSLQDYTVYSQSTRFGCLSAAGIV